jgi:hypothetical protein
LRSRHKEIPHWKLGALVLIILFWAVSHASADSLCPASYPPGMKFAVVKPAALAAAPARPEVIGGTIADPANWPATLILCTSDRYFCTSTAVGIRAIIAAAHCFDGVKPPDGSAIHGYVHLQAGPPVGTACTTHPGYKPYDQARYKVTKKMELEWSADVALCIVDGDLPMPRFERLLTYSDRVKLGEQITLLGFGCTLQGGGGDVLKLYQGQAPVKAIQTDTYFIYTLRDENKVAKEAALCSGDSGGGSFKTFDRRFLIGINSIADNKIQSWIVDISREPIQQFLKKQSEKMAVKICGLEFDGKLCR